MWTSVCRRHIGKAGIRRLSTAAEKTADEKAEEVS